MITGPVLDPPTIPFPGPVALGPPAEPVREAPSDSAIGPLDERIEAVLRGAVEGLGCVAAEVRLVDDAATEVRTAHHYTADDRFFCTATQRLALAAGELAAMSGSAVVLENGRALADWEVVQPVGSAICVPIASDTTIHGALWLYAAEERDADQPTLQLAEIIAGRIAVEFERHWLLEQEKHRASTRRGAAGRRSTGATRTDRPTEKRHATPCSEPTPGETNIAGMAIASADGERALHVERRLADGRVLLAAGSVLETPGLTQRDADQVKRAVLAVLDQPGNADAGDLLTRVGQHVWRNTTGGDALSMAVALIDEETGEATVALAGDAAALRVQAARRTPLSTDLPPIGWDDGARYPATRIELAVRERLLLAIGGPRQTGGETADQMASGFRSATADGHRRMTARQTLARASAAPAAEGSPLLAACVLRRD